MTRTFALAATLALSVLVVTPASAAPTSTAAGTPHLLATRQPKPGPWEVNHFSYSIPKGGACDQAITFTVRGEERYTEYSETKFKVEARRETTRVTNRKNHRRVTVSTNRSSVISQSAAKAKSLTIKVRTKGSDLLYGDGVTGIIYARGTQKFVITNAAESKAQTSILSTTGSTRELCTILGAHPVVGSH